MQAALEARDLLNDASVRIVSLFSVFIAQRKLAVCIGVSRYTPLLALKCFSGFYIIYIFLFKTVLFILGGFCVGMNLKQAEIQ
jgi:hypothetical protein